MSISIETPCERIRREARQKIEIDKSLKIAERNIRVKTLLAKICDGLPIDGPNADDIYHICGYDWRIHIQQRDIEADDHLILVSQYKKHWVWYSNVYNRTQMGEVLLRADESLANLKARYPDTLFGNLRAWWARTSLFL